MKSIDEKKNIIDTLEIARSKFPGSSNSLDNLCKKFNIDLSQRLKHNALLDCELLRKVYINLIGEKEPTLVFTNNTDNSVKESKNKKDDYSKVIIKPSSDELKKHSNFLKSQLRKNFF